MLERMLEPREELNRHCYHSESLDRAGLEKPTNLISAFTMIKFESWASRSTASGGSGKGVAGKCHVGTDALIRPAARKVRAARLFAVGTRAPRLRAFEPLLHASIRSPEGRSTQKSTPFRPHGAIHQRVLTYTATESHHQGEVTGMACFRTSSLLVFAFLAGPLFAQTTSGPTPVQLYEKGMNALTGTGVGRSDLNATDYIRRSAELGYAPGQVALGYFYETGTILTREPQQGAEWYKKAAQQDDVLGEWLFGRAIFVGETSVRDLNEAAEWLKKAAAHDDPFGAYLLGMIRLERNDYTQAGEWFRKAAVQGLPQAQQQLGQLMKQGKGMDVNKFEAYVWLLVSFDASDKATAADLQQLEGELGSNQVEEAKTRARALESSVTRAVVARGCTGWAGEFNPIPSPPPPDLQRFCR